MAFSLSDLPRPSPISQPGLRHVPYSLLLRVSYFPGLWRLPVWHPRCLQRLYLYSLQGQVSTQTLAADQTATLVLHSHMMFQPVALERKRGSFNTGDPRIHSSTKKFLTWGILKTVLASILIGLRPTQNLIDMFFSLATCLFSNIGVMSGFKFYLKLEKGKCPRSSLCECVCWFVGAEFTYSLTYLSSLYWEPTIFMMMSVVWRLERHGS